MQEATLKELQNALHMLRSVSDRITEDTNSVVQAGDITELVRHYSQFRDVNEEIKVARKSLELLEQRMSSIDIPDKFRELNIKTINIIDVGRVTVSYRWGCSMKDKQVGHQWLRDSGNGGLITQTVNSSSLAAFAKNTMETMGVELPQAIFTTSLLPVTSITKA